VSQFILVCWLNLVLSVFQLTIFSQKFSKGRSRCKGSTINWLCYVVIAARWSRLTSTAGCVSQSTVRTHPGKWRHTSLINKTSQYPVVRSSSCSFHPSACLAMPSQRLYMCTAGTWARPLIRVSAVAQQWMLAHLQHGQPGRLCYYYGNNIRCQHFRRDFLRFISRITFA